MYFLKKTIFPILVATIWISISEFARNELFFKSYWIDHFKDKGLNFPSDPINGAVWGFWSLLFGIFIYVVSTKFNLVQTTIISWFAGFVLMWVVTWNLDVLPVGLLNFAIPLSLLEALVATWIIKKLG